MLNSIRNIKFKILFFSFLITLLFLSLNILKKNNPNNFTSLRTLFDQETAPNICQISNAKLIEKYSKKYTSNKNFNGLTKYEKELKNVIQYKDMYNYKSYGKYGQYLLLCFGIIIVLDIIFIFLWITYIVCFCYPRSFFKNKNQIGCFENCSYGIAILFSFLVFVGGVIGLVIGSKINKGINSFACSYFKIFSHLSYGFENDYQDLIKWPGFDNIEIILNNAESHAAVLESNKTAMENISCNNYSIDNINYNACNVFTEAKNKISSFEGAEKFKEAIRNVNNSLSDFNSIFSDIENKYLDTGYDYLNNYVNKYSQIAYICLFGLLIVFGLLSLFCISIYVGTCKCIKCIYIIVWNIEMIIMIVIILIGVIFGLMGVLGSNAISIIQYTISEDNLNDTEPFLLNNYPSVIPYFNICFNGDGNLISQLNLNSDSFGSLNDLYQLRDQIKNYSNTYNDKLDDELIKGFKYLANLIDIIDNLFGKYFANNSILAFANCEFLLSDINIFIDELDQSVLKIFKLFAIVMITSGYYIGISVMFGILVMNRYNTVEKKKGKKVNVDDLSYDVKVASDRDLASNEKINKADEKLF